MVQPTSPSMAAEGPNSMERPQGGGGAPPSAAYGSQQTYGAPPGQGAPQPSAGPPGYGGPAPGGARSSGKAVAALVLGIVGFCLVWIPFVGWISLITGILALVLGALGKKDVDASGGTVTGTGMAVTGIVLGILQILLLLLFALFFAAVWGDLMADLDEVVALVLR